MFNSRSAHNFILKKLLPYFKKRIVYDGKKIYDYDIGKRIAYFRTQKDYSVNRLANLSGISQSFLRDVELGKKNITVEYLSYICYALDIPLADFFSDSLKDQLSVDPIMSKIFQLTDKQRSTLLAFPDSMTE